MPVPRFIHRGCSAARFLLALALMLLSQPARAADDTPPPAPQPQVLPPPPTRQVPPTVQLIDPHAQPHKPQPTPENPWTVTVDDDILGRFSYTPLVTQSVLRVRVSGSPFLLAPLRFTDIRLNGQHPVQVNRVRQQSGYVLADGFFYFCTPSRPRDNFMSGQVFPLIARLRVESMFVHNVHSPTAADLQWNTVLAGLEDGISFAKAHEFDSTVALGGFIATDEFITQVGDENHRTFGVRGGYYFHADNAIQFLRTQDAQFHKLRLVFEYNSFLSDGLLHGDKNYLLFEGEFNLSLGLYSADQPFGPWLKLGVSYGFRYLQSSRPNAFTILSGWALQPAATLALYW